MKHVIIGASAAGLSAAKTLRELNKSDEIIVVSSDTHVHSRCMLHHFLARHKTSEEINFAGPDFFDKNNISWLQGKRVETIDAKDSTLILSDGGRISYDRLLIATGACFVVPPIANFRTAGNVFGLRNLSDAEKIEAQIAEGKKCVIVGSGLVGLDAAYALRERGVECSIVEMADHISPLQLDYAAAAEYQKRFEAAGCKFFLDEKASDSIVNADGNITSLLLASGKEIPCDFIILAVGVRPEVDFLNGSEINVNKSVCVDEYLKTNIDNIWAAGDVAGISGIWPNAVEQGEVAAKNMLGLKTPYENRYALKNTMNFYGLTTLTLGTAIAGDNDKVLVRECRDQYQSITLRDDAIAGVILQGDISNSGFWQELVKNKIPVGSIKKSPFKLSYADFYHYNPKDASYEWAQEIK